MKILSTFLAVVGLCLSSLTAQAATCDFVWGNPEKTEDYYQAIRPQVIVEGTYDVSVQKLGTLLARYVVTNCKEQFALLPESKQTPEGFLNHVLSSNGFPPVSGTVPDGWVKVQLINRGLKLSLPEAKTAEVAVLQEQLTNDLKARKSGADVEKRLQEFAVLTAGLPELQESVQTLNRAFAKLQRGELSAAQSAKIAHIVNQQVKEGFANQKKRLDALEASLEKQSRSIDVLQAGLDDVRVTATKNSMALVGFGQQLEKLNATVADVPDRLNALEEGLSPIGYGFVQSVFGQEKAASYAEVRYWVYAAVIAVFGLVGSLIAFSLYHRLMVRPLREVLFQETDEKLVNEVETLKKKVETQESGLSEVRASLKGAQAQVGVLVGELIPYESNPTNSELATHTGGRKEALTLRFAREDTDEEYCIHAWRDADTKSGCVCIDVSRRVGSTELMLPVSVKRLVGALKRAIATERLLPTKKSVSLKPVEVKQKQPEKPEKTEKTEPQKYLDVPAFLRENAG